MANHRCDVGHGAAADGYRYAKLSRAGVPGLIDSIKLWHPDIAVGGGSCYLREEFYTSNVALDGESDGHIFVGLFKRGDELAGMCPGSRSPTRCRCMAG